MSLRNIVVAGATGTIGSPILNALIKSKHFNVTALTRGSSTGKYQLPTGVKTAVVDYADSSSLIAALKGQDAVVCAMAGPAGEEQRALLDAAADAGVKRFIPAQFGSDTRNAHAAKLPVFAGKKKIEARCEELAAQGRITYTLMWNGAFLDLALDTGFLGLDLRKKTLRCVDDGNAKFSATTRATSAQAVVGVLLHPEETKNRPVKVQDTAMSLRELTELSKKVLGSDGWTEIDAGSTADLEKRCYDRLAAGQKDRDIFVGFLLNAMFREGYGGRFKNLDNELLGIKEISQEQVMQVIADVAKA